jgi:hypothetical protein
MSWLDINLLIVSNPLARIAKANCRANGGVIWKVAELLYFYSHSISTTVRNRVIKRETTLSTRS